MFKVPEKYRETHNAMFRTQESDGNNGVFIIPHQSIQGYVYLCTASDKTGWEHLSISIYNLGNKNKRTPVTRHPTFNEAIYIKNQFWAEEDTVVQFINNDFAKEGNISVHLWRHPNNERLLSPFTIKNESPSKVILDESK